MIAIMTGAVLSACSNEPQQKPEKYSLDKDVSVGIDQDTIRLWELIDSKGSDLPATFIKSPMNKNCRVKRAIGSGVTNITAYEGDTDRVPLYFVKKRSINLVNQKEPLIAFSLKRARTTDVIVTKTDKPVNLLLSTHDANLWVIHSAPGVKINSINVLSYQGAGVIAPGMDPSKIKFIVSNSENQKCRPNPKRSGTDNKSYQDWQKWIRNKIGRVETNFDTEYRLEAVLVGPAPLEPIAASPMGGTVVVDQSRYESVFWGTREEAELKYPPAPDLILHSISVERK